MPWLPTANNHDGGGVPGTVCHLSHSLKHGMCSGKHSSTAWPGNCTPLEAFFLGTERTNVNMARKVTQVTAAEMAPTRPQHNGASHRPSGADRQATWARVARGCGGMERVFSVEEIPNPYWAPPHPQSAATGAVAAPGGRWRTGGVGDGRRRQEWRRRSGLVVVAFDRNLQVYLELVRRRGLDANTLDRWYNRTTGFLINKRIFFRTAKDVDAELSEVDIPICQFDIPSEESNAQANWTLFCHTICVPAAGRFVKDEDEREAMWRAAARARLPEDVLPRQRSDFEQAAQILGKPDLAPMTYSYSSMSSLLGLLLLYRFVLRYSSSSVKSGEWGNICA
ncbi:unnamed protein product [Miscanthus lutarioriparius]|uniref:Uncharacterized protein n=1 Tax=Miscanthus lutarioriparius TaxID=422564 RepID=A0A811PHR9_9POAL|nr:unnamed protein product [Miscanthus lutarioriparius]